MKNKKKLGYIAIEAVIISGIMLTLCGWLMTSTYNSLAGKNGLSERVIETYLPQGNQIQN